MHTLLPQVYMPDIHIMGLWKHCGSLNEPAQMIDRQIGIAYLLHVRVLGCVVDHEFFATHSVKYRWIYLLTATTVEYLMCLTLIW